MPELLILLSMLISTSDKLRLFDDSKSINEKIHKFCNRQTIFIEEGNFNKKKIKQIFLNKKIEILPLINTVILMN